jgi:hypothetical protein
VAVRGVVLLKGAKGFQLDGVQYTCARSASSVLLPPSRYMNLTSDALATPRSFTSMSC